MARVSAGRDGRNLHSRFLHSRDGEFIHRSTNTFPGMGWVNRVESNLPYLRVSIKLDRNKTDDSAIHLGSKDLPAGLWCEKGNQKLTLRLIFTRLRQVIDFFSHNRAERGKDRRKRSLPHIIQVA